MKTKRIALFWAVALVICAPFTGVAQGFMDPKERTVLLDPEGYSDTIKNIIIYQCQVVGNSSQVLTERALLNNILGEIKASGKKWGINSIKVYLIGKYDTSFYEGDVFNDNKTITQVSSAVGFGLGPKYKKLEIIADLNTSNVKIGDSLTIDLRLDISLEGLAPVYYHPLPQYVVYGQAPGSTSTTKLDSPEFTIFPNPFTNVINLSTFKSLEKVTLINNIGQEIYSGTSNSIETSNLISGIYTLCVYAENKIFTFKLSKL